MPTTTTLAELALDKTAASINSFSSLRGLPEELALELFELVLRKGKLTERSLRIFLDLVEEGKAREAPRARGEGDDGGGDLFATTHANFDDDDADENENADAATVLYSSLARRIASLRLQLPPPVVPTGTGRWLGDLPFPWR